MEEARSQHAVVDPMNGEAFVLVPDTQADEIGPFVQRLRECPRSGLHNPLKNVERYNMLGDVMAKGARELAKPEVNAYFAELIRRVVPKSKAQCVGEPTITRKWMENYCCDQARNARWRAQLGAILRALLTRVCRAPPGALPRALVRHPGHHAGQSSTGVRMPFGGVGVITPFNFPLEIPALQTCSALFMGNQPLAKVDWKVAIVMEQVRGTARFSQATPAPLTPSLTAYGSSATVH